MWKKLIGDKAFYRRVMVIVIPMIIQNGITNFVSMLDNIMVGQVGTVQMSGVAIVNQLMFVFNLCIFGAVSGAGIFTAQFFGSEDHRGIRHTFRFKVIISVLLTAIGLAVFIFGGEMLILTYLKGEGDPRDAALSLAYGQDYLRIMLLGLAPFALANAYSGTLRETGQTEVPMAAGVVAVFVNLGLNYVLIFGHFGAPAMGVRGAAAATVISRYVELAIVAGWTHMNGNACPFIRGAYRSLQIPSGLFKQICVKGMPLLLNEALWSSGMAIMNQCYSVRGLDVVAAQNISSTMFNISSVVFLTMGSAVGIYIGQMLGAGKTEEEVRDANGKLMALSVASCLVFGILTALLSGVFPLIYNTTDEVRSLAAKLILVNAVIMPFTAYNNAAYFTLRSGGQTAVTFVFDSCFVWVICVPLCFILSRFTAMPIVPMFALTQATELIKCCIGAYMIKRGAWIRNLAQNV